MRASKISICTPLEEENNMWNIIKSNFFFMSKYKSYYISGSVFLTILLIQTVLIAAIVNMTAALSTNFPLDTIIVSSLAISDSALVVMAIIITFNTTEFSSGAIRNKIAAGYSRTKIYFSKLLTICPVAILLYLVGFGLNIAAASIFIGTDVVNPSYIQNGVLIGSFAIIFVITFAFFMSTVFKKAGAALGVTLGISVFLIVVSTVIITLTNVTTASGQLILDPDSPLVWILRVIPFFSSAETSTSIGAYNVAIGTSIGQVLISTISSAVWSIGFIGFGWLYFTRTNIK